MTFGKRRREQAESLVTTGAKAVGVVLSLQDIGMTAAGPPTGI
jgi:hypothetical protein